MHSPASWHLTPLPLPHLPHRHAFAGTLAGLDVFWHSIWHIVRWALAGEHHLLWTHATGISGLISLAVTPLIVLPMAVPCLRRRIRFEWRKYLHYLSVVWARPRTWCTATPCTSPSVHC